MTMKHDEIHMKKRMQQAAGGEREYFFGATLSVAEFMIAEDLEQFIRNHPNCHIQMQVANTKVLLEKIDSENWILQLSRANFRGKNMIISFMERKNMWQPEQENCGKICRCRF